MSSQSRSLSNADVDKQEAADNADSEIGVPTNPPVDNGKHFNRISPFWQNRFIEASLILSMALYYLIGNGRIGTEYLFQLNPLYAVPFLLLFAALCWFCLPFAVALLPLTLPFYPLPKTVFSHYVFSLTEITFGVCLLVALIQLLLWRSRWQYWLSWRKLRDRTGPFIIPILVFLLAAAFSIVIAYAKNVALRYFRWEVLEPLLYVLLVL